MRCTKRWGAAAESRAARFEEKRAACSGGAFPWWIFWVIWPVAFGVKALAGLSAPIMGWLSRPLVLEVTLLPILLIGAGLAILVVSALRRNRDI